MPRLGTVLIGLRAIARQIGPVGPVVGDLIGSVVAAKKVPASKPVAALVAGQGMRSG